MPGHPVLSISISSSKSLVYRIFSYLSPMRQLFMREGRNESFLSLSRTLAKPPCSSSIVGSLLCLCGNRCWWVGLKAIDAGKPGTMRLFGRRLDRRESSLCSRVVCSAGPSARKPGGASVGCLAGCSHPRNHEGLNHPEQSPRSTDFASDAPAPAWQAMADHPPASAGAAEH